MKAEYSSSAAAMVYQRLSKQLHKDTILRKKVSEIDMKMSFVNGKKIGDVGELVDL